jgi:Acyl-CoA dehydrogenase, N-terminal domain
MVAPRHVPRAPRLRGRGSLGSGGHREAGERTSALVAAGLGSRTPDPRAPSSLARPDKGPARRSSVMTAGIRATGPRPTAVANGAPSSSTLTRPSYERGDLLAAVEALTPTLQVTSDEVERGGSLTEPLVQAMVEAGPYRMFLPRALGGGEIGPLTYFDVIEALAQADSAAAWSVLISTSTMTGTVRGLPDTLLAELFTRARSIPPAAWTGACATRTRPPLTCGSRPTTSSWPAACCSASIQARRLFEHLSALSASALLCCLRHLHVESRHHLDRLLFGGFGLADRVGHVA